MTAKETDDTARDTHATDLSRRDFVRLAGRSLAVAGLLVGATFIRIRNGASTRRGATGRQTCVGNGICGRCSVYGNCGLPAALSRKNQGGGK